MTDTIRTAPAPIAGTAPNAPAGQGRFSTWLRHKSVQRSLLNIGVALLIGIVVQSATGGFFIGRNLTGLFVEIAVVAMIACAMTLVMVTGSIDISVGGIVALSGVIAGLLSEAGLPLWLAFVAATVTGLLTGYINSVLVIRLGITSMIATIGTMYVTQGVANIATNGLPIAGVSPNFSDVGTGSIFGIPYQVPMIAGFVVLFILIQRYTRLGRHAIATGSNPEGAFLSGVNVNKTLTICFLLSGAAAGWGGVVYASRIGNPSPVMDQDLLFQVIVACVVGGISLTGGEGTVFGAFTGALLIAVVNDGLDLLGVPTFWQYVALGILLVLAVGVDKIRLKRRLTLSSSVFRLRAARASTR